MPDYLQNSERQDIHRALAETALGKPLPKAAEVHHVDENRLNNDPSNLVICPNREYHMLLHRRQKAMNLGYNLESQGYCYVCKEVKEKEAFYKNKARPEGITNSCKTCNLALARKRWDKVRSLRTVVVKCLQEKVSSQKESQSAL
jgi:hypothetical protein